MSDLVKRLRDWEHVWPQDLDEPEGGLYIKAADRIEELEAANRGLVRLNEATEARAKTAEAKLSESEALLAKAVELAEKSIKWLRLYGADVHREAATLAELTGGKDE